ncbi:hypothetical protein YC2023_036568 [Brassica napus]
MKATERERIAIESPCPEREKRNGKRERRKEEKKKRNRGCVSPRPSSNATPGSKARSTSLPKLLNSNSVFRSVSASPGATLISATLGVKTFHTATLSEIMTASSCNFSSTNTTSRVLTVLSMAPSLQTHCHFVTALLRAACYEVREVRPGAHYSMVTINNGTALQVSSFSCSTLNIIVHLSLCYINTLRVAKENNIKNDALTTISCVSSKVVTARDISRSNSFPI